jgi:hypothetical protein
VTAQTTTSEPHFGHGGRGVPVWLAANRFDNELLRQFLTHARQSIVRIMQSVGIGRAGLKRDPDSFPLHEGGRPSDAE